MIKKNPNYKQLPLTIQNSNITINVAKNGLGNSNHVFKKHSQTAFVPSKFYKPISKIISF